MLSRSTLSNLSEAELRRAVLIPMLRSMGFEGVQELHGPTEFGKDIVMWLPIAANVQEVYAVVVKTGAISGKVEGSSGSAVVFTQAMQALGSNFVDKATLKTLAIDKVWIVTTGKIGKSAVDALHASFSGASVGNKIRLIDGEELWELLRQFSPERTTLAELVQTARLLDQLNPNYRIKASLEGGHVRFGLEAKQPNSHEVEPLCFNLKFALPNTTEGQQVLLALDAHVRTGSQVRVPGEFIAALDVPPFLEPFFQEPPSAVEFGPVVSSLRVVVSLSVCGDGEPPSEYSLTGFALRCTQRGTEEMTLEADSPHAFGVVIVMNHASKHVTIRFRDSGEARNARQNWLATQFFDQLSKGRHLVVRDEATGIQIFHLPIAPGQFEPAPASWLRLSEALNFLQEITSTVIKLPEQISREDMVDVVDLADRIRSGIWRGGLTELSMTVKPGCLAIVMEGLDKPSGDTLTITQDQWFEIFDQRLELGKVVMIVREMRPSNDSTERASKDSGTEPFELKMVRRNTADNLTLAYLRFLARERRTELASLLPGLDLSTDEPELKVERQ